MPIGGGGLGFKRARSGRLAVDVGRRLFFSAAMAGGRGGAAFEGGRGGAPPGGGLRLAPFGAGGGDAEGEGLRELVSGSESYMFTPPTLLRSLGIPPANKPPNWGADSIAAAGSGRPAVLPP